MQNSKRRRNDHGRDGRDAKDGDTDMADSKPEEPPEDPLKNATTLYVGNLSVLPSLDYLPCYTMDFMLGLLRIAAEQIT